MIEKIVRDHISAELPAYMEVPQGGIPPPFAVIQKTGSGDEDHIHRATLAIQSYGTTLLEAAEANERVKARMEQIIELDAVCAVRLNSDYNYTDTAKKQYRYQAVYDIYHY